MVSINTPRPEVTMFRVRQFKCTDYTVVVFQEAIKGDTAIMRGHEQGLNGSRKPKMRGKIYALKKKHSNY